MNIELCEIAWLLSHSIQLIGCHLAHSMDLGVALLFYLWLWPITFPEANEWRLSWVWKVKFCLT
jgi:hypothetical protein